MLRFLRNSARSTAIKVLFLLLAFTFVLWGAGTYQMSRLNTVARVYDRAISQAELARETETLQRRFQEMTRGATLPSIDFRSQALNGLIETALIQHEADRLGLDVTETELVATITSMPELQRNGRFDRELLERVLEFQRERDEFENEVRQDILTRRFRDLMIDGVQVSPAEVEAEYRSQNDQVSLLYVRISADDAVRDVTLSEAELADYLSKHQERYVGPPMTRARYVAFAPADYQELAAPSPAQIEAFYEAHKNDRFTKPEEVRARHILVRVEPDASDADRAAARKRAEELLARVKAGEDFASIAKQHSDDPGSAPRGGDLGAFPRGRMEPTFEQAAFALEAGTVSDVVETPFGFHIIKVDARDPGGVQELAAVRDEIVAELTRERGLELARQDADKVRRAVVGGKSLAEAAGKPPIESKPFAEGALVPDLGRVPEFVKAAFALDEGQVSDLIEERDAIYILQPFERTGPAVPPLADIRARVEFDAKRAIGSKRAKEQAEKLLARAREVGLAAAAEEARLATQETGLFARRAGSVPTLGAAPVLREAAFTLTPAAPLAPEVYDLSGDAVVAALASQQPATMAQFENERAQLQESLLERKRRAIYERYLDGLKQQAMESGALLVRADALGPS
ncbi:MAG TPA: peptidylprolyl isomerase [Candidatus Limnocylindria bacterium]|nr:peptidylprolyl isomerase [Candidatus Limnocylindria bacterium]